MRKQLITCIEMSRRIEMSVYLIVCIELWYIELSCIEMSESHILGTGNQQMAHKYANSNYNWNLHPWNNPIFKAITNF